MIKQTKRPKTIKIEPCPVKALLGRANTLAAEILETDGADEPFDASVALIEQVAILRAHSEEGALFQLAAAIAILDQGLAPADDSAEEAAACAKAQRQVHDLLWSAAGAIRARVACEGPAMEYWLAREHDPHRSNCGDLAGEARASAA